MAVSMVIAGLMLAQTPAAVSDVGYRELSKGRNEAAIERIERNDELDANDPARLINLGVAHAREGRTAMARELFQSAAVSETRVPLETATGEWVDSRRLAKRALVMLEQGEFADTRRVATR